MAESVRQAQAGDREAFGALTAAARGEIEAFIRARLRRPLGRTTEVDDLVQETFLRAWESLDRFTWQGESSFARWLTGIAQNVVLEAASRAERRTTLPLEVDLAAASTSPSKVFRRHERFDRLEAALKSLSPEHREVLLLVRVQGLTIGAVADRLGRTANAVSLLLLRASRALRSAFGDTASLSLPERVLDLGPGEKGVGNAHR